MPKVIMMPHCGLLIMQYVFQKKRSFVILFIRKDLTIHPRMLQILRSPPCLLLRHLTTVRKSVDGLAIRMIIGDRYRYD